MNEEKLILDYTNEHYSDVNELISRSMINFYHSKLQINKTKAEIFHQTRLYEGVLDLFEILSSKLSDDLEIPKEDVYDHLKNIHIKT
jgi:hypothetical protein